MHNDITIRQASLDDLDLLIQWRMEVLHCVFSIPADADTAEKTRRSWAVADCASTMRCPRLTILQVIVLI